MNTTTKLIFALVVVTGLAATGAAIGTSRHLQAAAPTSTIHLAKIIVTPANVEPETIQLAAVVVTPANSDAGFAEVLTHNPGSPSVTPVNAEPEAIQLAAVVVTPADAAVRFADVPGRNQAEHSAAPAITADVQGTAAELLLQTVVEFSPGQYLNSNTALQALNALVFGDAGR